MLIDVHAHVIPSGFPQAPAGAERWPCMEPAESGALTLVSGAMRFTARQVWFDAERRLEAMEANGVNAEVLSPFPPLLDYALTPDHGLALARCVNEAIARLCEVAPGRFHGLGTVPLQDPELASRELAEVRSLGLRGIEIGSNAAGVSLGDERLLGFFQEAERLGIAIFVHALNPTFGDRLPPGLAMASHGFATEVGLAAASMISSGTAERCPSLRLAFSHGAGGFPLTLTRAQWFWGGTWNEEPPAADRERTPCSPADYARRFYYDTLVFDRRALRYLVDMLGPKQLLIGTDFPAMNREEPAGRSLRTMDLPAEVLEDITWHNCLRFLGVADG